jgi:transforming growth factor-beta-induced protein
MLHAPIRRALVGLALVTLIAAGCGGGDDDDATAGAQATTTTVEGSGDAATGDVLEVAAAEGDLGTFLAATEAAGVMEGLHGTGPFTVFAPTDEAFAAYLAQAGMSQSEVFGDPAAVQRLVEQHIVDMNEDADMVMGMDGQSFTTEAGTTLDVTVDGETVMVGDATVERYDLHASNGVIHVVDAVLVPPAA